MCPSCPGRYSRNSSSYKLPKLRLPPATNVNLLYNNMRRSRRIAGLPADQGTETAERATLKHHLEGMPPELYSLIKSFVFTTSNIDLNIDFESSTASTPCSHEPVHARPSLKVARINETWKPPRWMQVDRASRAAFSKQLFKLGTVFIFPGMAVMKKWIESLPPSDISILPRMILCCIFAPGPEMVCSAVLSQTEEAHLMRIILIRQVFEQITEQAEARMWFAGLQNTNDPRVSDRVLFVNSEAQVRTLAGYPDNDTIV